MALNEFVSECVFVCMCKFVYLFVSLGVFIFHLYSSNRVVVHASSRHIVAELKLAGARFRNHLKKTDIQYSIAMVKTEGKMSLDSFMEISPRLTS